MLGPLSIDFHANSCRTLCSDSVRIYVGKERELFTFHKDLLCSISGFFRAAFTGKFSEAAKQEMELDDVKVACFAKFVEWVYRDTFTIAHTSKTIDEYAPRVPLLV